MAATVQIQRYIGAGAAGTDITSACTRLGTEDSVSNGSPIRVPSSGSNYSFFASIGLYATVAADTQIDTIRWYSDGTNSLGTGLECVVGTASAYTQATGTAGSSGIVLNTTNYTDLAAAPSPAWQYTSTAASQLVISGSIDNSTGSFGDFVVLQIQVESTAGAGNSSEETFTFSYDES